MSKFPMTKKLLTHNKTKYVALPKAILDLFNYGDKVELIVNKDGSFVISKAN